MSFSSSLALILGALICALLGTALNLRRSPAIIFGDLVVYATRSADYRWRSNVWLRLWPHLETIQRSRVSEYSSLAIRLCITAIVGLALLSGAALVLIAAIWISIKGVTSLGYIHGYLLATPFSNLDFPWLSINGSLLLGLTSIVCLILIATLIRRTSSKDESLYETSWYALRELNTPQKEILHPSPAKGLDKLIETLVYLSTMLIFSNSIVWISSSLVSNERFDGSPLAILKPILWTLAPFSIMCALVLAVYRDLIQSSSAETSTKVCDNDWENRVIRLWELNTYESKLSAMSLVRERVRQTSPMDVSDGIRSILTHEPGIGVGLMEFIDSNLSRSTELDSMRDFVYRDFDRVVDNRTLPRMVQHRAKRTYWIKIALEWMIATAAFVIAIPFVIACMIILSFASRLEAWPLSFSWRIGRHGQHFRVIMFRCHYFKDGGIKATPMGRFLLRTSLYQVPSLLNVIFCQMSLVGPRPLAPTFASLWLSTGEGERGNQRNLERLSWIISVRPGIISPASVIAYVNGLAMLPGADYYSVDAGYARQVLSSRAIYWDLWILRHASRAFFGLLLPFALGAGVVRSGPTVDAIREFTPPVSGTWQESRKRFEIARREVLRMAAVLAASVGRQVGDR